MARLLQWAKKIKSSALSTVFEQESAERVIIQDLQGQAYEKEIKLLNNGSSGFPSQLGIGCTGIFLFIKQYKDYFLLI